MDTITAQLETDKTLLDMFKTSLDTITNDCKCVSDDYHACTERMATSDVDFSLVISRQDALCSSFGSTFNDVLDGKNDVFDRVGRTVILALRHMDDPLEGVVKAATTSVLG